MTEILPSKTIRAIRSDGVKILSQSKIPSVARTPSLDCDCLLSFVLGISRTKLLAYDDQIVSPQQQQFFFSIIEKRLTGLPIPYITSQKEFFGYNFFVTPDVLIPKPDTELLVEKAIEYIRDRKNENLNIADICTGSGCIVLSIKKFLSELPLFPLENMIFFATDISQKALDVAKKNATTFFTDNNSKLQFIQSDLLAWAEQDSLDLIISNPPYIPSKIVDNLLKDGRNEPRIALDGDIANNTENENQGDGLGIIRKLIKQSKHILHAGGTIMIETGEYNAKKTMQLLEDHGFYDIQNFRDIADLMRVTVAKKI